MVILCVLKSGALCAPACGVLSQNVAPSSTVTGVLEPTAPRSVMASVPSSTRTSPANAVVAAVSTTSPAPRFTSRE